MNKLEEEDICKFLDIIRKKIGIDDNFTKTSDIYYLPIFNLDYGEYDFLFEMEVYTRSMSYSNDNEIYEKNNISYNNIYILAYRDDNNTFRSRDEIIVASFTITKGLVNNSDKVIEFLNSLKEESSIKYFTENWNSYNHTNKKLFHTIHIKNI